jgi:hypothetical protein
MYEKSGKFYADWCAGQDLENTYQLRGLFRCHGNGEGFAVCCCSAAIESSAGVSSWKQQEA